MLLKASKETCTGQMLKKDANGQSMAFVKGSMEVAGQGVKIVVDGAWQKQSS